MILDAHIRTGDMAGLDNLLERKKGLVLTANTLSSLTTLYSEGLVFWTETILGREDVD